MMKLRHSIYCLNISLNNLLITERIKMIELTGNLGSGSVPFLSGGNGVILLGQVAFSPSIVC